MLKDIWKFLAMFLMFVIFIVCFAIENDVMAEKFLSTKEKSLSFDHYHHADEMKQIFYNLAAAYPNYARVGTIGRSVEGRDLYYIEISENVNSYTPGKPKVKYVGNMHGDETIGRELIIYLSQYLLYTHKTDERSHNLLRNLRIFLMPTMNPDGFERSTEGLCNGGHRSNFHQVDLNRNFPDQFQSIVRKLAPEPETQAMMNWIRENKFVLSVNFHAGSEVASYPFDSSPSGRNENSLSPDDSFFKLMAHTYANAHPTMHLNDKKCGDDYFDNGITNGAHWYDVTGGMQDFNYLHGDCMEITVELTCCKYPAASELEREWGKNKNSLIETLELAYLGVRGFVLDGTNGNPLENVIVSVAGITKQMSTDPTGAYWRLLVPGTYKLKFAKNGYVDSLFTVEVDSKYYVTRNVTLMPLGAPTSASETGKKSESRTVAEPKSTAESKTTAVRSTDSALKDIDSKGREHGRKSYQKPEIMISDGPSTIADSKISSNPTDYDHKDIDSEGREHGRKPYPKPEIMISDGPSTIADSKISSKPTDYDHKDKDSKGRVHGRILDRPSMISDELSTIADSKISSNPTDYDHKDKDSKGRVHGRILDRPNMISDELSTIADSKVSDIDANSNSVLAAEPSEFLHHNQTEMTSFLKRFNRLYPDITRLYSVGKSTLNQDLWVMEISDNPGAHEPGEPEFKYIANMHGNEVVGRELLLNLVEYLCINYGRVEDITWLVDNTRIHLMPTMNPDGYARSSEFDSTNGVKGRNNGHNVDLNRNFPDKFGQTKQTLEPETVAVIRWMKRIPFVLSANMHGGSLVANYPYDSENPYTGRRTSPDDAVFKQVSRTYSYAHRTMSNGRPCPSLSNERFPEGITNGAEWYLVSGGMQDWNYFFSNCFEITLELGCIKFPHPAQLPSFWNDNKNALIAYINQVHRGVAGFVKDQNGNPLANAVIVVDGIAHNVTSAVDGDYWRLLVTGRYKITAYSDGFLPRTAVVNVNKGSLTPFNFTLVRPGDVLVAHTTVKVYEAGKDVEMTTISNKEDRSIFGLSRGFVIMLAVLALALIVCTVILINCVCRSVSGRRGGFHRLVQTVDDYYDDVVKKEFRDDPSSDEDDDEVVFVSSRK